MCYRENGEGERWRRFTVERERLVCFSPEHRVPNGTLVRVKLKNRIHKPATVHCAPLICDAETLAERKNCSKNSVPAPPPLSVSLFFLTSSTLKPVCFPVSVRKNHSLLSRPSPSALSLYLSLSLRRRRSAVSRHLPRPFPPLHLWDPSDIMQCAPPTKPSPSPNWLGRSVLSIHAASV